MNSPFKSVPQHVLEHERLEAMFKSAAATTVNTTTVNTSGLSLPLTIAKMQELLDDFERQSAGEDKRLRDWMAAKGCPVEDGWQIVLPLSAMDIGLANHKFVSYSRSVIAPCFTRMPMPAQSFPYYPPPRPHAA